MAEDQLLRIKRSPDSDDGIIFAYLKNQGQRQTDLACEAIRSYWLPLALKERGIKKKELKLAAQNAIAQLSQRIEVIRLACGLSVEEMPFSYLSMAPRNITTVPSNSAQPASTSTKNVENTDDEVDKEEDIEEEDIDDPYGVDAF